MKIEYDKNSDAKYIRLKRGKIFNTKKEKDWLLFDYTKKGDVLGIEVLNSSKHPLSVSAMDGDLINWTPVEFQGLKNEREKSAELIIENLKLPEQKLTAVPR